MRHMHNKRRSFYQLGPRDLERLRDDARAGADQARLVDRDLTEVFRHQIAPAVVGETISTLPQLAPLLDEVAGHCDAEITRRTVL